MAWVTPADDSAVVPESGKSESIGEDLNNIVQLAGRCCTDQASVGCISPGSDSPVGLESCKGIAIAGLRTRCVVQRTLRNRGNADRTATGIVGSGTNAGSRCSSAQQDQLMSRSQRSNGR